MNLLPLFVNLDGRKVLLVGGGPVAAAKLQALLSAGARVVVVAPQVVDEIDRPGVQVFRRAFVDTDLDEAWFVVAAATPEVNAEVAAAAESRRLLVNAVDDPAHASAYFAGVLRRGAITVAISSAGAAPGLTALLRQAIEALLPHDAARWADVAQRARSEWRQHGVPLAARRPLLLETLNRLYEQERAK